MNFSEKTNEDTAGTGRSRLKPTWRVWRGILGAVLLVACAGVSVRADQPTVSHQFRTFGGESGLPHPVVHALAQTADGYLWVATPRGLARFDGREFRTFGPDVHPVLDRITAVAPGANNRLWLGASDGGVAVRESNEHITEKIAGGGGIEGPVRDMLEDTDGVLWINAGNGLGTLRDGRYDPCGQRWGKRWGETYTAYKDPIGRVRVISGRGVWEPSGDGLHPLFELPADGGFQYVAPATPGRHWVSGPAGLYLWTEGGTQPAEPLAAGPLWCFNHFETVAADDQGGLWVASGCEGLFHYNAQGERRLFNASDGLGAPNVTGLLVDREGVVWVGTRGGGLSRIQATPLVHWGNFPGLDRVSAIHCDSNDTLFLATRNGSVMWIRHSMPETLCEPLESPPVEFTALVRSPNGALLAGTHRHGMLDIGRGSAQRLTGYPQPERPVHAILAEKDAGLWLGSTGHRPLLHCRADGVREYDLGPEDADIRALLRGGDGTLWIGTETHGLYRMQGENLTSLGVPAGMPPSGIRGMKESRDTLWVATAGSGLWRWRAGTLRACTMRDGLPDDALMGLQADGAGALWLSSSRGVFRIEETRLQAWFDQGAAFPHAVVFGKADGVGGLGGSGDAIGCSATSPDGRLWFATNGGLVEVRPERFRIPSALPVAVAEGLEVDGAPFSVGSAIPDRAHRVTVRYNGLFLTDPEGVTFETRLDRGGAEESAWIHRATDREFVLNDPNPGIYRLEVRAIDRHGRKSAIPAVVAFTILPPFWQRGWFVACMGGVVLAGAVGSTRWLMAGRLRRERERAAIERAVAGERGRIARDMHDEISGGLSELALLGEHLQRVGARPEECSLVSQRSRELMDAINETVWLLNPQNDNLEGMASFLCRSALRWTAHSGVACRLDVDPEFADHALPASVRRQLLLCCREAVHNVIRHAGASELWVRIRQVGNGVTLAIADNGRGFPDTVQTGAAPRGNGLRNIAQRMAAIDGSATFRNLPDGGAEVTLDFHLAALPVSIQPPVPTANHVPPHRNR